MKSLVLSLALLLSYAFAQAQVIELEEARIDYFPNLKKGADGSYSYVVKESLGNTFHSDAIGFMKQNFDIYAFIAELDDESQDGYLVTFKNSKGYMEADFDRDGELRGTEQKFRDILLPAALRDELYKNHKGWTMVKNKYTARGKGDRIDSESYSIKLKNGNEVRSIKLNPRTLGVQGVASK